MPSDREELTEAQVAEAWDATGRTSFTNHWRIRTAAERQDLIAFAHRIAARSAPVDLDAVRREAAREALTALCVEVHGDGAPSGLCAWVNSGHCSISNFRDREYPAPAPDRVVQAAGPYTVHYSGAFPCPYRVRRSGVEASAFALASQASAWLGRQDDGFHLDDAQMAELLAFAARVGGQP